MPGPAAATSAPAASSSTSTTRAAASSSGGHIACAGVGIPLPINWRLPGPARPGARRPRRIDREYFNHSMAVGDGASTTCRSTTTASSSTTRSTTPGACRSPGSRSTPHAERPRPGPLPHRPQRRDPRGGRRQASPAGLHRPDHRQLLAPARHHADGRRPGHLGARPHGAGRTRSTTSSRSTAARSRPAPAPTRR